MSIAKVTEVIASSPISFEDAIKKGIERAHQTIKGVQGAWIKDQQVEIKDGQITSFRVTMKITFVLK
jgi:dodecin